MALLLAAPPLGAQQPEEPPVTWRGEDRTLQDLRGGAAAAAEVAAHWTEFAGRTGYRLVLTDDRRALLVLGPAYARRKPKTEQREVGEMLELVAKALGEVGRFTAEVPEGTPPVVVVALMHADYPRVLEQIGRLEPRVRDWAAKAAPALAGFVLSEPLVGAWVEDLPGREEWNPHNELVHRVAQLAIRQQTPHLPPWLLLGLAWHVEDCVRASIYAFPHCEGFIAATAHTDWGHWLANEFKPSRRKKSGRPAVLQMDEFATWIPGHGAAAIPDHAYVAFGVARYLVHQHAGELPGLLRTLHARTEAGRTIWITPQEWRSNPDYQLPAGDQLALLEAVEQELLPKATDYFRKGMANRCEPSRRSP